MVMVDFFSYINFSLAFAILRCERGFSTLFYRQVRNFRGPREEVDFTYEYRPNQHTVWLARPFCRIFFELVFVRFEMCEKSNNDGFDRLSISVFFNIKNTTGNKLYS